MLIHLVPCINPNCDVPFHEVSKEEASEMPVVISTNKPLEDLDLASLVDIHESLTATSNKSPIANFLFAKSLGYIEHLMEIAKDAEASEEEDEDTNEEPSMGAVVGSSPYSHESAYNKAYIKQMKAKTKLALAKADLIAEQAHKIRIENAILIRDTGIKL